MHGFAQQPAGLAFERQVALDDFLRVLANVQLAEFLQVGQAFHKKNALDQAIGVFHLVDGFAVFVLVQLLQAPVLYIRACRKYWLMAVSSFLSARLR